MEGAAPPRILLVEDSQSMRQLMSAAVRRFGGEVFEAEDGLAALKLLTGEHFDLIFCDLNMPVLDGFKLIRRVREDGRHASTPICIVTTEGEPHVEQQARELGANYFLRKPTNRREVDFVLHSVLGPRGPQSDE